MRWRSAILVVLVGVLAFTLPVRAALPASDAFTGTGALSGSWSDLTFNSGASRLSDVLKVDADSSTNIYRWNADTFADDQYAQFTLVGVVDLNNLVGPAVRLTGLTSTLDGYFARCSSANCEIRRVDNGSDTLLATVTMSPVSGDVIKLEAVGTTLSVYQNGSMRGSTTDATYTSGDPGFYLFDGNVSDVASLDNFLADNVTVGGGGGQGSMLLLGVGR